MSPRLPAILFLAVAGLLPLACESAPTPSAAPIRLATTTSTENSGLLKALVPPFEERSGARVHVIPVGTGQALAIGRNGDADVVLVHAPAAEEKFVQEGHGVNRRSVMYNDFIVLGPSADPAAVAKASSAADAMTRIARSGSSFVSRADQSGTHMKEQVLWEAAGIHPAGAWYLEAGQGMGATLLMADEKAAYCLSDRGTYLSMKAKLRLAVLFQGGEVLRNPYSVIAVNPARHTQVNYFGAMQWIAWMTSPEGQRIIGDFKAEGQVLFHPTAVPETAPPR